MKEVVLGIIDAQRGFMPAEEGNKVDKAGFGELPVPDGEKIVRPIRDLAQAAGGMNIFTTQDWHPEHTAHFSEDPNFVTNWPVHCVAGTPGARLHPLIENVLGQSVTAFFKGQEELQDGKDDLSYSGFYATAPDGLALPEWLAKRETKAVILGGLALDYCVRATALDLRQKLGLQVLVAAEATRGIAEESVARAMAEFEAAGVEMISTEEGYRMLRAAI